MRATFLFCRAGLILLLAFLPLTASSDEMPSPQGARNLTAEIRAVWKRKARELERLQLMPKRSRRHEDLRQPSPFEMYAAYRALSSGDVLIDRLTRSYMNAHQRAAPLLNEAKALLPPATWERLRASWHHVLMETYDIRPLIEKATSFVDTQNLDEAPMMPSSGPGRKPPTGMQNIYDAAMMGFALLPTRLRLLTSALRDLHVLNGLFQQEGKPTDALSKALSQHLNEAFAIFEERWTIADALAAESRINAQARSLAQITYKFLEENDRNESQPPAR